MIGNDSALKQSNANVSHRCFRGSKGSEEHFFAITAPGVLPLEEQIASIETQYAKRLQSLGLASHTAIFRRIFLSDAHNLAESIRRCAMMRETIEHPVSVSIIQQPPLPFAKIALFAYHIGSDKPFVRRRISSRHVLLHKNGLGHLWSTGLCSQGTNTTFSPARQTRSAFKELISALSDEGGTLAKNCVRTWIYLRDIDTYYQSMVSDRRKLFLKQGLTPRTHFIASTGIQGANAHRYDLINMDAYSIIGLDPKQVSHLNNFDKLCAAQNYRVTFERGTRIVYADRSHFFISGTASIDNQGNSLHAGDVLKQLDRTLENMDALLWAGEARLADMMYMIIYLRDPADFERVEMELSRRCPSVPVIFTQSAVCRPEWLIEIEGVAIKADHQPSFPSF